MAANSLPVPDGLERDGVALRRLRARDAHAFAAAFRQDPQLGVNIGADEDPTETAVRRFIARQPGLRARGEFLGLAVTDETKRPFLGHVMLHTLSWRHKRGEIGYWLIPEARGRHLAKPAVSLLVDWAFETLDLDRLEITTTPDNAPARALAQALGFREEGVMIARNLERGRRIDVVLLARVRDRCHNLPGLAP
ncbi:GNAT family N-acetyltransferase [Solirubrobacter sp. CPCC 204708]|uniref:GNAT family N-acetyltransferase n=1 Tax=Solirubrobacter deserti TaxID=2282478 RepID=A0ABT4RGJ5_9ACTN|nr:GNAT family N-acetyltransferase [Solirubrobacter deserti]MBE2318215.1 GNAT family N-acetyltransferase [Solirubrobacter deserti]MDA0137496.1 GNAT family N-acetyltransferase [Solirubrobacter deserti]